MAFQRRCRPDILRLLDFVLFISINKNPCILADADSIHISGVGGSLFPHPGRKAARAKHIPKRIPQDFRQEEGRPSWGDTIETRRLGLHDRSRILYRSRRPTEAAGHTGATDHTEAADYTEAAGTGVGRETYSKMKRGFRGTIMAGTDIGRESMLRRGLWEKNRNIEIMHVFR